jgi:RNA polymerase-binding transcription factor DksA
MSESLTLRQQRSLELALINERNRLRSSVGLLLEAERAYTESQGMESSAGGEQADVASDVEEASMDLTLEKIEEIRLGDVEAALRRLKVGTYGTCEICKRPIGVDRLVALPWTPYCIRCSQKTALTRGKMNA